MWFAWWLESMLSAILRTEEIRETVPFLQTVRVPVTRSSQEPYQLRLVHAFSVAFLEIEELLCFGEYLTRSCMWSSSLPRVLGMFHPPPSPALSRTGTRFRVSFAII